MRRTTIFAIAVLLLAATTMPAHAATITVTNTNDSGPGSLRHALANANNGDTITFAVTGTIALTSGGLQVARNVTISGPGANQLAVDGNQALFVFGVFPQRTVSISGMSIRNGQVGVYNVLPFPNDGGCACMTIIDSVVSNNAENGIYNSHSAAFLAFSSARLTVVNSNVSDNGGSGIRNDTSQGGGSATIVNTTVSGNSAGGIFTSEHFLPARVTVTDSTISGNSAYGGIHGGFELTVTNSTISGNSAGTSGGGIHNTSYLSTRNSTIAGNSAGSGGGIYNDGEQSVIEVSNTTLNAGALGANIFNSGGTVTSNGYNLSSDDGGGYLIGPGDQINTDPLLGPLQNNGGPTFTHALLPGSPAIDAGNPNFFPPPSTDQRGCPFDRVFNGRIDIGSYETQPPPRRPCPRPRPTPVPRPTPPQ